MRLVELSEVEIAPGETLPFFEAKQDALIGHLLRDDQFFLQARTRIRPEWFLDAWNSRIWKLKIDFYEEHHRPPLSLEELQGCLAFMRYDQGERNRLIKKMALCVTAATQFGLDAIRKEMTLWLKTRMFKAYSERASTLYNAAEKDRDPVGRFNECFAAVDRLRDEIRNATFEVEELISFADVANGAIFEKRDADLRDALAFGSPLIDGKLNKDCADGGSLLRGDHTVILAPTNIGKTSTLVTVVRHNLFRKRNVLFLTHEGRPEDIKLKMLQCLLRMNFAALRELPQSKQGRNILAHAARYLTNYLTYIPVNKPGLTVEEVEGTIRRAQEKRVSETGKGYDLIVDDYPAKLSTSLALKGNLQKRNIDEYIYNFFTQIGLEFRAHVLTAIQTNREGSKVNAGRPGTHGRLVTMEDVLESWGAMTTATNVITLNRDGLAATKNRMTFHIVKSRSNETGWSIVSKTAFDICQTHGEDLTATCYRGSNTLDGQIDDLLVQHAGAALPETYYLG